MISQISDGGAIEADGGASAPVGPSVATPLAGSPTPENGVRILKSLEISLAKIGILYTFYGQYALIYSTTLLVQDYTMHIYAYGKLIN